MSGRGGGIQRRVLRRIAGQREKKKDRGDKQKEPDQLIEPAVPGRRKNPGKLLHEGVLPLIETQSLCWRPESTRAGSIMAETARPGRGKLQNLGMPGGA